MIPVPGFEGRRVAVFGLGRSGITAARALQAGGAIPVLWDDGVSGRMQAEAEGFLVEDLTRADWSGFAALVLSPGAPLTHPKPHWSVERAHEAGVPVIGDVELFARALAALPPGERPRVVAITGTNGKSTTTALIGWVLKQAGLSVHIGGNIGIGVLALPEPTADAVYVIEVSSYQLDLTTGFAPDVAILTNVSPDHLDRHGGMEGYVAAKRRIFQAQDAEALALVGVDEEWGRKAAADLRAQGRRVETVVSLPSPTRGEGYGAAAGVLTAGGDLLADLTAARSLPGRHNAQNAAFAYAAARALGVSHEAAVEGLLSFPGLSHRMEAVGRLGSVRFINDSKATNADAARQALASYPSVFWIAGGKAKDGGIDSLRDLFPRVTQAYLIGEAADAFAVTLADTPHVVAHTMERAVELAAVDAAAAGGEQVVVLSPACASFDQFPDFEVRGEAFRAAVLSLGARPEPAA
ncbi:MULTISPECIES: UDP-N-acetylmuramoyl-L-alanine--D-glutamate ligase [Brevundimonas]|uniref:UDP-N-acetylmuramoyl-L-alanine--D-glutamate ligase n=1 Tax=Brevundimonas TaxID=41275 RepID=UPI0019085AA5|nr:MULTISPECIES: UDP-N-acetylmuramoyl-L-alanine--D-glutamate ligase [Brevundimonas]MDA0743912.1 UDP-N-acetylmuramoyl-L-alanine--D-glutamate ligase [Pseudomonadota bacterium]MBK1968489.1 UDP-N-acetylmuramoyl-L-alanine--D-glutamate ligase [Brevundimonas diminuta]MBK1976261.1 UDP-N-acetylmuramoyl-L-alanine--D-glutamate ligase [Brevundimonas diminuta]MDA1320847.1 UDP-N-acetylmuramoyl-L-alanine--D-glutamate ligase [Pseudomonadota bacterium]MDM8353644.1 UDP-N-acetylmuramoyl-L-alanine--D-glutamate li